MDTTTKKMIIIETVKTLIAKNKKTTTLEVKQSLRNLFSSTKWMQNEISNVLSNAYLNKEINNLEYKDNGVFREYYIKDTTPVVKKSQSIITKPKKLSRTDIVDLMKESKGKFFTVTFIKKDGSERIMNGQVKKSNFMDNLGYINFKESNGKVRRVNPQTITEISISKQIYKVK